MGFPRRDRRTDAARLAVSTMAWHSAGSDVTKIVPQRGIDAFGPVRQARAQQTRCVSGATHGRSVSSHTRPRLHIGYGRSPGGETPRSVRGQRCASQPPTQEHTSSDRDSARARTRGALDPLRGGAQPADPPAQLRSGVPLRGATGRALKRNSTVSERTPDGPARGKERGKHDEWKRPAEQVRTQRHAGASQSA